MAQRNVWRKTRRGNVVENRTKEEGNQRGQTTRMGRVPREVASGGDTFCQHNICLDEFGVEVEQLPFASGGVDDLRIDPEIQQVRL